MSIWQHKSGVYHVDITIPGSTRVRHSTGSTDRQKAQEYHDTLKARLWREVKLGETPTITWDEAALRWLREMRHKASLRNDVTAIKYFTAHWRGKHLSEIGRDQISKVIDALRVSNSTRNRYVACVRAILRCAAREWGVLDQVPPIKTYREPKRRIRWLTQEEAQRLVEALPDTYATVTSFAFNTGLRMSNILDMEWSQIDLVRRTAWVHADQAKANKPITVPLNDAAVEIIRSRLGKDQVRVFGHIKRIESRPWKAALLKAGITDFKFHDTRHTWASWHVQNGTPLHTLQELGGWECVSMVRKYAHLSSTHLAEWARHVNFTPTDLLSKKKADCAKVG